MFEFHFRAVSRVLAAHCHSTRNEAAYGLDGRMTWIVHAQPWRDEGPLKMLAGQTPAGVLLSLRPSGDTRRVELAG